MVFKLYQLHTESLLLLLFIKIGGVRIWYDANSRFSIKIRHPFIYNYRWFSSTKVTLPQNTWVKLRENRDIKLAQCSTEKIRFVRTHPEALFFEIGKYLFRAGKL